MSLTTADKIARTLRQEGIEIVIGLPGGENVPLVAALDQVGIRFVLVRHESRAVWAADAYARIGRRVSVCLSTLGPGAVNLAAGCAHAYLDRSPVLAITAQLPDTLLDRHSHQRLDLQQVFSAVTKASLAIGEDSDAEQCIHRAVRIATEGRLGPVHVQLSSPVAQQEVVLSQAARDEDSPKAHLPDDRLAEAVTLLQSAHRPALLVGLNIEPSASYVLLREMAEFLQAAVIVTPKAKGAIPESHPLYAGVLGLERREFPVDILDQADLIIGVGFDPVELMVPWSFDKPFIFVSSAPNADPEIKAAVNIIGDLPHALSWLVDALKDKNQQGTRWHTPYPAPDTGRLPDDNTKQPFGPSQVVRAARDLLPDEGIVTVDVGAHKLLIGKLWEARNPNCFLVSNGLSTMGYGLPAAIGAKLARPDLPVVCFTGDGGLGMVDSELETAVRMRLPLVVVVLADEAMSLIRLKQLASGYKPIGTEMGPTDWVQVAQGYGAYGIKVTGAIDFKSAFASALMADLPTLIEARIDPGEYQTF